MSYTKELILDNLYNDNDFSSLRAYLDNISSVDILTEQLAILLAINEQEKSHIRSESSNGLERTSLNINYDFTLPTTEELLKLNEFFRDDYSKVIKEDAGIELSVKYNEDELYGDLSDETRLMLTNFDHTILEHVKAKQNAMNLKIGMKRNKRHLQDGSYSVNTNAFTNTFACNPNTPTTGSNETKAIQLNKNGNPIIRRRKRRRFVEDSDEMVKNNADNTYLSMVKATVTSYSGKSWPDAVAVCATGPLYTLASTWMGTNSDFSYLQNIATENQHVRVNVQPEEILCDLILELQKQFNLQIFIVDKKLQELKLLKQETPINNNEEEVKLIDHSISRLETSEQTDALSLSLSSCSDRGKLFYTSVVNGLGINIGRGAAAVCGDVLNIHKEYIEGFEAAWQHTRKDSIDRSRKRWDSMHNYYHNTHEKKIGIDDVPYFMDRIPNPFNIFGGDARKWDWLTSSTSVVKRLQRFSKAATIGTNFSFPCFQADNLDQIEGKTFSQDSILHPFIHSKSLYYNKVSLKECVHKHHLQHFLPNLLNLHTVLEESHEKSKLDFKNNLKFNNLTQEQLWVHYLFASVSKSSSPITNIDLCLLSNSNLVKIYEDEWSINTLTYCIDHAVQLLNLPICSSINVIDKCDLITPHEHKSLHRAVHISCILSRFLGREALNQSLEVNIDSNLELETQEANTSNILNVTNKNTRRKSGVNQCSNAIWGPVLVVVRLIDISSWEDALTIMCNSRSLQLLPYYGSYSDRLTLRSYIKPNSSSSGTSLCTERSHSHVILINYETLLQDLHHFTDILWCFSVFDEPWGMISNNKFVYPWKQLSSLLQARQKIFSTHCITRMQTDINASHESDSVMFTAPGIVESISALCPFVLGISSLSNKIPISTKMISQKSGFSVLPNSVAMLSYDSKKKVLDLSEICLQYLSRLLASLTIVYDADIIKLFKALNTQKVKSNILFGLFDELMCLLPYFEWFGLKLTLESNSGTSDYSNITKTYTFDTCQSSSTSTFIKTLTDLESMLNANLRFKLKQHTITYSSEYEDVQLEKELENLNLYAVGMVGTSVQRFKQGTLEEINTNPDQCNFDKGNGRGRFKAKVGNESVESNGRRSYIGKGRGGVRGRGFRKSPLKEETISLCKSDAKVIDENYVNNEIFDSGNNVGDDDDNIDNEDEDDDQVQIDDDEEVIVEVSDIAHNTDDVGEKYPISKESDFSIHGDDKAFTDRDKITFNIHQTNDDEESKLAEFKTSEYVEENCTKNNTVVDTTMNSNPSIPMRLTLEQMRVKYPAIKRDVKSYFAQGLWHSAIWCSTIPISTRLKFLGVYSNEADTEKAFSVAYDRNELYLESCHNPKLPHLFKSRNNASVRITDGSFVSSDYYKDLKIESIMDEITFMSSIQSGLGYPLKDWHLTTCPQPPCFAKICSIDGSCIDITNLHCYLGKAGNKKLTNLMLKLGDCQNGSISGLNFKYERESSTSEVIPHIHLEFDSSIACKHALLKFNHTYNLFEIQAISMAGIYVNGLRILPEHGSQTLRNRSVLQIGSRIMYFILPNLDGKVNFKLPIEQSCALLQTLLEYAKLRIYSDCYDDTTFSIKNEDMTEENNLSKNIETLSANMNIDESHEASTVNKRFSSNCIDPLEFSKPQHWMNRLRCLEELSLDCGQQELNYNKLDNNIDQKVVKIQETIDESDNKRNAEENKRQKKKEFKENLKRERIEMKESLKRDKEKQQHQQLQQLNQPQVQEPLKFKRSYKRKAIQLDANIIDKGEPNSSVMNISNNISLDYNSNITNNNNSNVNVTFNTNTSTTTDISFNTTALTNLERLGLIACELLNPSKIKKPAKVKKNMDTTDSTNPNPKQKRLASSSMKEVRKKSKELVKDSLHTTAVAGTLSSSSVITIVANVGDNSTTAVDNTAIVTATPVAAAAVVVGEMLTTDNIHTCLINE